MLISLDQFRGSLPRIGPKILPHYNSSVATDVNVMAGELRPAYADPYVTSLGRLANRSSYKTIYKYLRKGGNKQWLSWSTEVDIVPGPVFGDVNNRIYLTGLDYPRVTDSSVLPDTAATIDTTNSYKMGVSSPEQTPLMEATGTGTKDLDTRTYVYTYVREWADGKQDESKPSAVAETSAGVAFLDLKEGQAVKLTNIRKPTASDEGTIKYIRLYRTLVGSTGATNFQFLTEFSTDEADVGNYAKVSWSGSSFEFEDDIPGEKLGEVLPSKDWDAPVDELTGIVSLQNGVLAGFKGKDVYLSVPYRPHAWPSEYVVTLDFNILGLGSFGNTLVVCTDSHPFMLNVTNPATGAVPIPVNVGAPCLAKRSIVSADNAVYYATATGVAKVDSTGFNLVTQSYYSPSEWEALNPVDIEAEVYRGRYIMSTTDVDGHARVIYFSLREQQEGAIESTTFAGALYTDAREDALYGVILSAYDRHEIHKLDDVNSVPKAMKWKSKEFISEGGRANLSAARVIFSDYEYNNTGVIFVPNPLGYLNSSLVNTYPINGDLNTKHQGLFTEPYLDFILYVEGKEIYRTRVKDSRPFRLPAGVTGKYMQFALEGTRPVAQVDLATSMKELA